MNTSLIQFDPVVVVLSILALLFLCVLEGVSYVSKFIAKRKEKAEKMILCLKLLDKVLAPFDPQQLVAARTRIGDETEQWMIEHAKSIYPSWQKAQMKDVKIAMDYLRLNSGGSKKLLARVEKYQKRIGKILASE
ncbi:MAG: hypothetical protein WC444_03705 [Candidatus Paceibacterota bacterium]